MKKRFQFLGHKLSQYDHRLLLALISAVHLPLGSPKRSIKTDLDFWEPINRIHGLSPLKSETFQESVKRILKLVRSKSRDERDAAAAAVGYGPETFPPYVRAAREAKASKPTPAAKAPSHSVKQAFYASWEWRTLRMEVLKEHGNRCQCCGAGRGDVTVGGEPVVIVVDHIRPLSKFWDLRLERRNLQVLCQECNQGKGNWDETDWRGVNVVPFVPLATGERQSITDEQIEAERTGKGGWKMDVLKQWGVPWPPPKGWRKALVAYGVPYSKTNPSPSQRETA